MPDVSGWQMRVRDDGIYWGMANGWDKVGSFRMRMSATGPIIERCTADGWTSSEKFQTFDGTAGTVRTEKTGQFSFTTVTTTYTVGAADNAIAADATGGAFTITLLSAVTSPAGTHLAIGKKDSSTNAVTIAAAGTQTVGGAATYLLTTQSSWVELISDGANWQIRSKSGGSANSGTATIGAVSTSTTITHNAGYTPASSDVFVVPTTTWGTSAKWWVDTITSTTFKLNVDAAPGGAGFSFGWRVVRS